MLHAIAWAGVVVAVAGFLATGLWRQVHWPRVSDALLLMGMASGLAWLLKRLAGLSMAGGIGLVWALVLLVMAGPLPVLAVALLAAAALGIGLRLNPHPVIALACGLGLIAGVLGWVVQWPVHLRWLHGPMVLVLVLLHRHAVIAALRRVRVGWTRQVAAAPTAAAWAMLLLGVAGAGTWLPTMQFDDLAYHLGLPTQLQQFGVYRPDAAQQVWAFAPWAGDVLQALARVLADADARGALNMLWLLLAAAGLHHITGALGGDARLRWAGLALFATVPLTQGLTASMQTELPAAATTLALGALLLQPTRQPGRRDALAGGVLLGLLAGLKLMHPVLALPLLLFGARRQRGLSWRDAVAALPAFVLAGGSSYLAAWLATGNPVLPLFNGRFGSPFMPARDFDDPRWHAGFDPLLPWDLSFHTHRYFEGHDGSAGLLLIAGIGLIVLALHAPSTRGWMLAAVVALTLALLPLQYARYAWVPLVLAIPAIAAAMGEVAPRQATALLVALCSLQFLLLANADWTIRSGAIKDSLSAIGRNTQVLQRFAPQRLLAARIDPTAPGTVLTVGGTLAELGPRGRTLAWYAPTNEASAAAADRDASGSLWRRWLRQQQVREVLVVEPDALTPALRAGLSRSGAARIETIDDSELWRLPAVAP